MAKRGITTTRGIPSGRTRYLRKRPQPPERPLRITSRRARPIPLDDDVIVHRRGKRRLKVGEDPLEARAVPKAVVRGTLPERIFYRALENRRLHSEFTFQSSLAGGRLELGGMVADFLFPNRLLIVRVQGYRWHSGVSAQRNDDQQKDVLEDQGFTVLDIWDYQIYMEPVLEDWLRRNIDIVPTVRGTAPGRRADINMADLQKLSDLIATLTQRVNALEGILGFPASAHLVINEANITTLSASRITAGALEVGEYIESTGFTAGSVGFRIEGNGDAEFENVIVRGELKSTAMVSNVEAVNAGVMIISDVADIIIADVAAADTTIDLRNNQLIQNDIIHLQPDSSRQEYMQITNAGTAITGGTRYTVTRNLDGSGADAFKAGEIIAKVGTASVEGRAAMWAEAGDGIPALRPQWGHADAAWAGSGSSAYGGWVRLDGTDENGPYIAVTRREGGSYDNFSDYCRMGRLTGFLDYGASKEIGIGIGEDIDFLSWDKVQGLRIQSSNGVAMDLEDNSQIRLGTGDDATIEYDGTDLILNPDVVGSGVVRFHQELGDVGSGNTDLSTWTTPKHYMTFKDKDGTTIYVPAFKTV